MSPETRGPLESQPGYEPPSHLSGSLCIYSLSVHRHQRITFRRQLSPPTLQVLGIKLRSSGLAASVHWAVLLALGFAMENTLKPFPKLKVILCLQGCASLEAPPRACTRTHKHPVAPFKNTLAERRAVGGQVRNPSVSSSSSPEGHTIC